MSKAKALIAGAMEMLGVTCREEVIGGNNAPWRADLYLEVSTRKLAIEIQRSAQHLEEYFQ